MNIYLLRHATAKMRNSQKYPDDDRPLTRAGAEKMRQLSKGIGRICPKADIIITSPMKRTLQTSKILEKAVRCKKPIKAAEEFLPEAPLRQKVIFIKKIRNAKNVFIVGHEPGLSELMNYFLGINPASLQFKKGGISLIMLEKNFKANLKEFISPKVLIKLATKKIHLRL